MPISIKYFWNLGSILGINLVIQILSGLFLSFYYGLGSSPFAVVDLISRDILGGWFVRSLHIIGASTFFIFIFLHVLRGIYCRSFWKNPLVWIIGVLILLVLMLVSFLGYVLPWGNMSFWGAMVITNFLSTLPYLGVFLLYRIWGGLKVCEISVYRFFSLHFIMPFVLVVLRIFHMAMLHVSISSNPLCINNKDSLFFFPYFWGKDIVGFFLMFVFIISLVTFFPYLFCDAANFMEASFSETPEHIKPEWYFLPFYAILRAFTTKSSGVLALVFSVVILIFFFLFVRKNNFIIKVWLSIVFILGVIGGKAVEEPFIRLGKLGTFFYFSVLISFMIL